MSALDMFGLTGKTALVTGSSRGLGQAMAGALAEAGAQVIVNGRDAATVQSAAAGIRERGGQASEFVADLGDAKQARAAFQACLAEHGPIDILVNNIGGRRGSQPVHEQTLESWQASLDLNLTSCFLGTQIIGGAMRERGAGGRVINTASMNAFISNRGIGNRSYEAAKAAVVQFTRAVAADWAPDGVNVNAICPGLFMTDVNRAWAERKPEVIETLVAGIPMGRAGEPHEIGPLAVFLASEASSYVTGATFVVDGGYTLW